MRYALRRISRRLYPLMGMVTTGVIVGPISYGAYGTWGALSAVCTGLAVLLAAYFVWGRNPHVSIAFHIRPYPQVSPKITIERRADLHVLGWAVLAGVNGGLVWVSARVPALGIAENSAVGMPWSLSWIVIAFLAGGFVWGLAAGIALPARTALGKSLLWGFVVNLAWAAVWAVVVAVASKSVWGVSPDVGAALSLVTASDAGRQQVAIFPGVLIAILANVAGVLIGILMGRGLKPGLEKFRGIWPYMSAMALPIVGFAWVYLLITVMFAGYLALAYRLDPAEAFTGLNNPSFGDFVSLSLFTVSTLGYSGASPHSPLARTVVGVEVLIGTGWIVVVFAAVVAYLRRAFDAIAESQREDGSGGITEMSIPTRDIVLLEIAGRLRELEETLASLTDSEKERR